MIVGFTGSREGPVTQDQLDMVSMVFESLGITELHHGDCLGWDETADRIANELDVPVFVHPPTNDALRAFCDGPRHVVLPKKGYLDRNEDIVKAAEVLVGCPGLRGRGSTYTMHLAARRGLVTYEVSNFGHVRDISTDRAFR